MHDFTSFNEFLKKTAAAKPNELMIRDADAINSATFAEMQAHVLSLYQDIPVEHSFLGQDGQYVDCVPIDQQPSVRGSRGTIAEPPTPMSMPSAPSDRAATEKLPIPQESVGPQLRSGQQDSFGNEQFCPSGTIPMRRITLEEIARFGSLENFFKKQPRSNANLKTRADAAVHRYAHAYQQVNNNGGASFLNVWQPTPAPNNFSLSQHWYVGGNQTLEGGWQVYPIKYQTALPCLFIYWTADGYNQTGNYNLDKPAFVQTNQNWVLGGYLRPVSVYNGAQYQWRLQWQRDGSNGNWWLYLAGAGGIEAVGYYPQALYGSGQLAQFATGIDYGGEVTGATSGQMGSGASAGEGWQKAAYQSGIFYLPTSGGTSWATLTANETPNCYTTDLHNNSGDPNWGTYFFFGGNSCS